MDQFGGTLAIYALTMNAAMNTKEGLLMTRKIVSYRNFEVFCERICDARQVCHKEECPLKQFLKWTGMEEFQ